MTNQKISGFPLPHPNYNHSEYHVQNVVGNTVNGCRFFPAFQEPIVVVRTVHFETLNEVY